VKLFGVGDLDIYLADLASDEVDPANLLSNFFS